MFPYIDLYLEIYELRKLGFTEEDIEGYLDVFLEKIIKTKNVEVV